MPRCIASRSKTQAPAPLSCRNHSGLRIFRGRSFVKRTANALNAKTETGGQAQSFQALSLARRFAGRLKGVLSILAAFSTGDFYAILSTLPAFIRFGRDGSRFPAITDWGRGFQRLRQHYGGGVGPLPTTLAEEAETLFEELLASASAPILLRGDLHHANILSAQRQNWPAIDPEGVIGEPAYKVGALLRNLWEDRHTLTDPAATLQRCAHQLAEELEVERARVRGWAMAQAVLSAWWCIEDNCDCWAGAIAGAEIFSSLPKGGTF